MNFDEIIERRGTHSSKWDGMESYCGVSPEDGLPMWVADMDFRPPACVQTALQAYLDTGIYGYFGDDSAYLAAICWWMDNRHGWTLDPKAIFSTHGLVNGTGLCIQAYTQPGDGVVLFTPVYHAFARVIKAAGRAVVECELALNDGRYEMDFEAYDAQMTGKESMVILCSPHNPGGRVWTREELQGVADFAKRHDLVLVSDEIHHDLVMPGQTHLPMALVDESIEDRLVMMTSSTKTFNLAGGHVGNVIIHNKALRARFAAVMGALGISPNSFAMHMATAAYSPEGAAWVDALCDYLDGNCRLFDAGIDAIPGLKAMRLEGTYLAWVDFSGTGMAPAEVQRRILEDAKIAVNFGEVFGAGGEGFQRFNLGTQRVRVEEAIKRMEAAFSDLQ
ncbi:MalY/PatB family protein [Pseudooceanicola spongiae]|jgi:cysteine-S-conjugate beta-lyase|uniref:cysteine-S-conjugate beta-lyase n=1 Tax=Pseudooceanicola spongiae TaxID=2613965 RepID=A0A7L9WPA8_9RHOB|nr:MalY/PatB family protein [Pseudooceanicola spongiae]QOL81803.1 putative C-S lyase [Pseudooceanicola spongiae]